MASNQMLALLGLLAVAGYQNRDKLGELFGRVTARLIANPPVPPARPLGLRIAAAFSATWAVFRWRFDRRWNFGRSRGTARAMFQTWPGGDGQS